MNIIYDEQIQNLVENSNLLNKDYKLDMEILKNLDKEYISTFLKQLKNHPKYNQLKDNYIIDEKLGVIIQIHERILLSELKDFTSEESSFYPICSKSEIKRIFNVKNANDFLLKYRAEQVINNQRILRVFFSIRKSNIENWNFTRHYHTEQFKNYLNSLPNKERILCKPCPIGTIHMNNPNGYCLKTKYGNIIVISFALRHFLYYMNMFHLSSQLGIADDDKKSAFIIAIRILIGTETLDFEIDSRGEVPKEIHEKIESVTETQMRFVIGHEYAHHYLNHLENDSLVKLSFLGNEKTFNPNQKNELEADIHSIMKPEITDDERSHMADCTFLFFSYLNIFETVKEYMHPASGRIKTHPDPIDRFWHLRENIDPKFSYPKEELVKHIEYYENFNIELISELLPFNIEKLEKYGAVYLPSYKEEIYHDRLL